MPIASGSGVLTGCSANSGDEAASSISLQRADSFTATVACVGGGGWIETGGRVRQEGGGVVFLSLM